MTVLAEKLGAAGFDANETEFMTALSRYLNKGGTIERAQELVASVSCRMKDTSPDLVGARPLPPVTAASPRPINASAVNNVGINQNYQSRRAVAAPFVAPYKPRIIPPETIERRAKLQEIVRSKFKTSDGRHWSEVGWHELTALARDGGEAAALLKAGPASVPNDGRSAGDVLGIERIDEIIKGVRAR